MINYPLNFPPSLIFTGAIIITQIETFINKKKTTFSKIFLKLWITFLGIQHIVVSQNSGCEYANIPQYLKFSFDTFTSLHYNDKANMHYYVNLRP